jgi:hypothetical protein
MDTVPRGKRVGTQRASRYELSLQVATNELTFSEGSGDKVAVPDDIWHAG